MARAIAVRTAGSTRGSPQSSDAVAAAMPGEPASKARRHDLLELGQRANRRLVDPGHRVRRHRPQSDRDRDRLVVVEQERRHLRPGGKPVAALDADRALHRVAEVAQPVDIAADRPPAHFETLGELAPRPGARRLEQGQKRQESRGGAHGSKYAVELGPNLA